MSKYCIICKNKTQIVFGINLKQVPICEPCAKTIFIQQARWYTETTEFVSKKKSK